MVTADARESVGGFLLSSYKHSINKVSVKTFRIIELF